MRGTPPTVPSNVMAPDIKMPEKIRTFDEAAVLVGNEKTLADSGEALAAGEKDQAQVPGEDVVAVSVARGTEQVLSHHQSLCAGPDSLPAVTKTG